MVTILHDRGAIIKKVVTYDHGHAYYHAVTSTKVYDMIREQYDSLNVGDHIFEHELKIKFSSVSLTTH